MSEGDDTDAVGRRKFLRTAAGAAAAASATGTAAAQEGGNGSSGGNSSGGGGGGGGGSTTTVKVGPGGQLVFQPEEVQVSAGGTVKWVWESGGHNVVTDSGDWSHEPLENPGFTYEHTFQSDATYDYHCVPHQSAGMVGSVVVGSGGSGGSQTLLPNSAKSLGVAAVAAMISTLGLAYFFIRYGGDYEAPSD